jgi:acid phosphatase (class A)
MGRHSFRENSELFWNPIMRELGGWSKRSRVMNVHNSRTFLAPVLAIILFAGAPSFAEEPPCPKPDPLRLSVMLMAPPCDDCEQTTAELGELVKLQNLRTPDQAKHAKDDHEKTIGRFLHEVGIQIDDQLPVAGPFFKCIADAAKDEIRDAKTTFHRTRPYKLPNNELQFLKELKDDDSFSYPSGHAIYGTVVGLVLAEMIPEKREKSSSGSRTTASAAWLQACISAVMFTQGKLPGLLSQLLSLEPKIFAMPSGTRERKYANLSVIRDLLDGMQDEGNFDTP